MSGSAAVAVVSSSLGLLYLGARQLVDLFTRRYYSSITVTSSHDAFINLLLWLSRRPEIFVSGTNVTVHLQRETNRRFWEEPLPTSTDKPKVHMLPGQGTHLIRYHGVLVWVQRVANGRPSTTGWMRRPYQAEDIHITCLGSNAAQHLRDLIADAMEEAFVDDSAKTKVYSLNHWADGWELATAKPPRPFGSVVLDPTAANLLEDAKTFLTLAPWYSERGIPHRRGYLLYGPPGSGKTSYIMAVCGALRRDICNLSLSSKSLSDESLSMVLNLAPRNAIVVLEDVDALWNQRDIVAKGKGGSDVTFSGLLNALDGVASQDGRIMFMTTNHLEKLDPALIRPGRCDVKVLLDYASTTQVERTFALFYPTADAKLAAAMSARVPRSKVSMAALQGHYLRHRDDPEGAIADAGRLVTDAMTSSAHRINDIRIDVWLARLGLPQYADALRSWGLLFVSDLSGIDFGSFCGAIGIENKLHVHRMSASLGGAELAARGFAFATAADARDMCLRAFGAPRGASEADLLTSEADADAFALAVPPESLSIFQLQGLLASVASPAAAIEQVPGLLRSHAAASAGDAVASAGPASAAAAGRVVALAGAAAGAAAGAGASMDQWLDTMGLPADAAAAESVDSILALCANPAAVAAAQTALADQGVAGEAGAVGLLRLKGEDGLEKLGLELVGHRWAVWDAIAQANSRHVRSNLAAAGWTMARAVDAMDDAALTAAGVQCGALRWRLLRALRVLKAELTKVNIRDGVNDGADSKGCSGGGGGGGGGSSGGGDDDE